MKRRICSFVLCFVLIIACPFIVLAESAPKIIDSADLLTTEEVEALEEKARSMIDTYDMDVVILTVNDLDGKTAQAYADDYYDENGYGIGDDNSGILFLISIDERDWYISTCGNGIYALTDYGIQSLFSEISAYLADDSFYEAFDAFLDALPRYFEAFQDGAPIDGYVDNHQDRENVVYYEEDKSPFSIINIVIGLAAAGVVLFILCASMNTKKQQYSAGKYLEDNSFHLNLNQDIFLHSTVTKTRKPENNSSGGSGSSTHTSSSGATHGGGGGKF